MCSQCPLTDPTIRTQPSYITNMSKLNGISKTQILAWLTPQSELNLPILPCSLSETKADSLYTLGVLALFLALVQ